MNDPVLSVAIVDDYNNRNYGLDILKFIAMVYVVMIHSFDRGIIQNSDGIDWLLYKFVFLSISSAVDIFAVVSGYVAYRENNKPFNVKRLVDMWLQVFFYGVAIVLICDLFTTKPVGKEDYINAFFPLSKDSYWYFTCYFLVYLCSPIINASIRAISERLLRKYFIIIVLFFSVACVFTNSIHVVQGCTVTWMYILYFLGAVMKKCKIGESIKTARLVEGIILFDILLFVWNTMIMKADFLFFSWDSETLISHVSPLYLLSAVFHLILFSRIRVNALIRKLLTRVSPFVFTAYLLNANLFLYQKVFIGLFDFLIGYNPIFVVITIVVYSFIFVFVSVEIDRLRVRIFNALRINLFAEWVSKVLTRVVDFFSMRIVENIDRKT